MIQLFVNREQELDFLEKHYKTESAELVIYGRAQSRKNRNHPTVL